MKALAIVELPDDADLTKYRANINIEKVRECGYDYEPYTFRLHCPLRPMPTKKVVLFDPDRTDEDEARRIVYEVEGYNRCVDEILGETE